MGLSPGRKLAYKVVNRVRSKDSYAAETMQSLATSADISSMDKAFATRLAFGTIACRGTLDELVATELTRPASTPDTVKDALAISAYELFFEKTEPYVVVNQGVELVRFAVKPKNKAKAFAGLANAVLRRLSENRDKLFPGGDPHVDISAAATLYGHPLWLAEMLKSQYGIQQANKIMAINNEPAPLYLATLPFLEAKADSLKVLASANIDYQQLDSSGVTSLENSTAVPFALRIEDKSDFWAIPALVRSSFIAMDLSAQQVVSLVGAQKGQNILEVGSGRGSKSLLIAAHARNKVCSCIEDASSSDDFSVVTSAPFSAAEVDEQAQIRQTAQSARILGIDLYDFKTRLATKNAAKYGVGEASYLTLDVTEKGASKKLLDSLEITTAEKKTECFDTVLVDAPCSGLGTLRRSIDKRWKIRPEDITALAELNLQMLCWAAPFVKANGLLIYSTCTISSEENQDLVESFLNSTPGEDFFVDPVKSCELANVFEGDITTEGYFASLPKHDGPDGHFAARLRRRT